MADDERGLLGSPGWRKDTLEEGAQPPRCKQAEDGRGRQRKGTLVGGGAEVTGGWTEVGADAVAF